ncbi:hypothetical protein OFB92_34640, partial [Escherichia coli]|nr:hypothetical protein [Escherichia coli]
RDIDGEIYLRHFGYEHPTPSRPAHWSAELGGPGWDAQNRRVVLREDTEPDTSTHMARRTTPENGLRQTGGGSVLAITHQERA